MSKCGISSLSYFLTQGVDLGHDPNPLFSSAWYLYNNLTWQKPEWWEVIHYLLHGAAEHRDPHPTFSASAYLQAIPICPLPERFHSLTHLSGTDQVKGEDEFGYPLDAAALCTTAPRAGTIEDEKQQPAAIPIERKLLAEVVAAHSSDACGHRIVSYFNIIERLELNYSASSLSREEKLAHLVAHTNSLSLI